MCRLALSNVALSFSNILLLEGGRRRDGGMEEGEKGEGGKTAAGTFGFNRKVHIHPVHPPLQCTLLDTAL